MQLETPKENEAHNIDSENFIIKSSSSFSHVRRCSLVLMPLASFQCLYGLMESFTSAIIGALAVFNMGLTYAWSSKVVNADKELLGSFKYNESLVNSMNVFVWSLIQSALNIYSFANSYFQRDSKLTSTINEVSIFPSLFLMIQVFLVLFYIIAAETAYSAVTFDEEARSRLLSISCVMLFSSSLGIIWSTVRTAAYSDDPLITTLYSPYLLQIQGSTALFMSLVSIIILLSNYKKWRPILLALSSIVALAVIIGLFFSLSAYGNSAAIYRAHADMSNHHSWTSRMGITDEASLINAGCPSKYLEDFSCDPDFQVRAWEKNSNEHLLSCLNTECSQILARIWAEDFLKISNWQLLFTLSSGLVLIGMLYFWNNLPLAEKNNPKDHKYFGFTFLALTIFIFSYGGAGNISVQQFSGSLKGLQFSNMYAEHPALSRFSFTQSSSPLSEEDENDVFAFLFMQAYKYIILQVDEKNTSRVFIYSKGDKQRFYSEMINDFEKINHGVGLIWTVVETEPRLFVEVYINDKTPDIVKKAYGIDGAPVANAEFRDDNLDEIEHMEETNDIGIVGSGSLTDLILENVLQTNKNVFKQRADSSKVDEDEIVIPHFTNTHYDESKYLHNPFNLDGSEGFDPLINNEVDSLRKENKFKYVSFGYNGKIFVIDRLGDPTSTYNDFLSAMPTNGFRFIVYNFAYENIKRPICVLWNANQIEDHLINQTLTFIDTCGENAMTLLPTDRPDHFDLDYLIYLGAIPDPVVRSNITKTIAGALREYLN